MKNYLHRLLAIVFGVIFCFGVLGITTNAESIDHEKSASLKIVYANDGVNFEGLEVELYRVASVADGYTFQLESPFNNYSVNINDVESNDEWRSLAITLSSYAVADSLTPVAKNITNENGVADFRDLSPGMYLTMGIRKQVENEFVTFENFLTVIPYPSNDGESYLYDLTVYPKCRVTTPREDMVPYKVIKQWKDDGKTQNRPESVKVEIFKDAELYESVTLSSENNWTYSWRAADDGSVWRAVERDVSAGYFVNVSEQETTLIVTNSADKTYEAPPDDPESPKTGDTRVLWPYVLTMCLSGCILIILSIRIKRTA